MKKTILDYVKREEFSPLEVINKYDTESIFNFLRDILSEEELIKEDTVLRRNIISLTDIFLYYLELKGSLKSEKVYQFQNNDLESLNKVLTLSYSQNS